MCSLSTVASAQFFAAATIINSPATAVSQIERVLDTMLRERRPVYIGISVAVAGQPMPGASASRSSRGNAGPRPTPGDESVADQAGMFFAFFVVWMIRRD